MGLKVNPSVYNSVFVVPGSVVSEHLKLVSGPQLKVLLYVLAHSADNVSAADVADGIGISVADTLDALQYWKGTGYIFDDEAGAPPAAVSAPKVSSTVNLASASEKKALLEVPDIIPTYDQVGKRLIEDPMLKELFNEIQMRLGKTIGYDTQAKVLMMTDSYGLPPEVILTIFEYSISHGKTGMAYICKVGKNWAEEGIDSLEKAEEKLEQIARHENEWNTFTGMISVDPPHYTDVRSKYLSQWRENNISYNLIYYAYEEMLNQIDKVNFKYMDSMLKNWTESGYKTPQEVMQAKVKKAPASSKNKYVAGANSKAPSYNVEAYKQKARGPIEYKRRKKNGE